MIEINGIYKNFGAKQALRDVSFNVAEGEIMGFLGRTARARRRR